MDQQPTAFAQHPGQPAAIRRVAEAPVLASLSWGVDGRANLSDADFQRLRRLDRQARHLAEVALTVIPRLPTVDGVELRQAVEPFLTPFASVDAETHAELEARAADFTPEELAQAEQAGARG